MLTVTRHPGSAGPSTSRLEWKEFPHARQSLSVAVSALDLTVVPKLAGPRESDSGLRFQGTTEGEPRKGLPVAGAIEPLSPGEQLGPLFDQWKNPPKEFEGYGFLVQNQDAPEAEFRFSLYCKAEAFDSICRTLAFGLVSPQARLGMEITISFPDYVEPDFWRSQWRHERWNVTSWKVVAHLESGSRAE